MTRILRSALLVILAVSLGACSTNKLVPIRLSEMSFPDTGQTGYVWTSGMVAWTPDLKNQNHLLDSATITRIDDVKVPFPYSLWPGGSPYSAWLLELPIGSHKMEIMHKRELCLPAAPPSFVACFSSEQSRQTLVVIVKANRIYAPYFADVCDQNWFWMEESGAYVPGMKTWRSIRRNPFEDPLQSDPQSDPLSDLTSQVVAGQAPPRFSCGHIGEPAAASTPSAMPTGRAKAADEGGVPGEGMPAAGSQWVYGFIDRQYGRSRIDVTVRARRVDGFSVNETVTTAVGSSDPTTERLVDAGVARFRTQRLAEGAELTEFAPYFLAVHGEKAPMVRITADGYPVGSGNPAWIIESKAARWEQVTVPAGTFRALRLEVSGRRVIEPFSPIVIKRFLLRVWYAPEVKRYVRLEHKEWLTSTQNSHIVVELLNFGPAS